MLGSLGGGELLVLGGIGLASLACTAFWVWMLIDCIRRKDFSDSERLMWVLVIVLANAIGALVYLLFGRQGRAAAAS